ALIRLARHDSSYATQAEAMLSLARSQAAQAYEEAMAGLSRDSFNEVIRAGALEALGETGDPRGLEVARAWCAAGRPERARNAAVTALGTLLRENRSQLTPRQAREYREFLVALLGDPSITARTNAAESLGKLG